jgi:hypothetical protein
MPVAGAEPQPAPRQAGASPYRFRQAALGPAREALAVNPRRSFPRRTSQHRLRWWAHAEPTRRRRSQRDPIGPQQSRQSLRSQPKAYPGLPTASKRRLKINAPRDVLDGCHVPADETPRPERPRPCGATSPPGAGPPRSNALCEENIAGTSTVWSQERKIN